VNSYLHETIFDLLASQAERRPDAVAIEISGATSLTYGELFLRTKELIQALNSCGVARGSRGAIVLPNGAELAASMLAVSSIATSVPLNPAYRRDEFRAYFDEIRVSHLLTLRNFPSEARTVANERKLPVIELSNDGSMTIATDGGQARTDLQHMAAQRETELARPEDIALILLTSGSTGRSKKVPLTHRNICVSVADICRTLALTPADRCLCMWEQFHIGGLVDLLLVPLASGGAVICAGGFNAALFYDLLGKKRPTWFQGVPTTLHDLSVHARKNDVDPRAAPFRFIRSVASSLSPQLMQEIEDLFGVPVIQTFGMTEAGPLITSNSLPPGKRRPGSVGVSCGPRIRIVSPDGNGLPSGSIGEIVIQGENVISGYEDAPDANAKSFHNGWFHSGDTGYIDDDGFVFLTGRLKEMINRGGEKITPQEIDDVLLTHPEIAQAASFSIKHRTLGEDVAAAVVLRSPKSVSESDIRGFVMRHLADFKVPKMVIFLDQMPRDPIGKISRMSLAVLAEAQRGADPARDSDDELEEPVAKILPGTRPALPAGAATDTRRRLLPIWREVLETPDLGLDDDFFLAGGESLAAVTLFTQMEQALGPMPPMSSLLEFPTVRRMAARLDQLRTSSGSQPVMPIRATGHRPPLILCHAANSNVLFARQLLPFLDEEQPFFAIRARGLEEGETPHNRIEAMAADYVEDIKRVRPTGPYIIAGNCAGGYTAYEMARQLRSAGDEVAGIVLIDPDIHPNTAPWFHWDNPNATHIHAWRVVVRGWWAAKRRYAILRRRFAGKPNRREPFETGMNRVRQSAIRTGFIDALKAYRPRPYDGDIHMFCCARSRAYLSNPKHGWQTLARHVEFIEVGQEHEDLFHEALPVLATALNKVLTCLASGPVTAKNAAE
jgi:oxalate---CoA ligase